MRCIQVAKAGGPEELKAKECSVPEIGSDDVLINIKAAGINYIDIYIRNGLYKPSHYPYTPGKEGSGIINKVGENVKDLKPGDRVAFCLDGSGSYAEYAAVPGNQVVKIPDTLSFEMAGAIMLQGLTAYYLSHLTYQLGEGDIALIHAGAGGVGLLLIQIAKLLKAKVITTVSSVEKAKLAEIAGADEVVIYTEESFLQKTLDYTNGQGVNVVYDGIGKNTFADSMKSLTTRGMLVSFGQASGPVPPVELSKLAEKSLYLTRPSLSNYARTHKELQTMAAALFNILNEGKLEVTIGQLYALEEAATAHANLESRKTIGKSILII